MPPSKVKLVLLRALVLGALGAGAVLTRQALEAAPAGEAAKARPENDARKGPAAVRVVRPVPGGLDRTTRQPCTVHAFERADLYPRVSGLLRDLTVDIGDRVKKGQVLARIDAPLLTLDERQAAAALKRAQGKEREAAAGVAAAKAQAGAGRVAIAQREAEVRGAGAKVAYRRRQYDRIKALAKQGSVDAKLVDEQEQDLRAAEAEAEAARAALEGARAELEARLGKVVQAEAARETARADLEAAQITLERARLVLSLCTVVSPFDGVVTRRGYWAGDYLRPGDGRNQPLLTVERADKFRVVVQVPDQDVPYTDVGTPAEVTLDALPGVRLTGLKVARVAYAEDEKTRTMRTEIDVPNPGQRLRPGMYGAATLVLGKGAHDALRVPASALVSRPVGGLGNYVYVVRGGKAHRTPVRVGAVSGGEAEVLSGLRPTDEVVADPRGLAGEAVPVEVRKAPGGRP